MKRLAVSKIGQIEPPLPNFHPCPPEPQPRLLPSSSTKTQSIHRSSSMAFNQDSAYLPLKEMASSKSHHPYESSLGSAELKPAPFQLRQKKRKVDYWAWEWMALVASFIAVVASAVILVMFDNRPIPEWSWQSNGVSVNSILSLLSTLSRASLLVPIDECIGQLMWLRYALREQKLADVKLYAEAARGPMGAARLLWKQKGL